MNNTYFKRRKTNDKLDFFPTPPWVTRALFEYVLGNFTYVNHSCLEPACGAGHMSEVLKGQFRYVLSTDIQNYNYFDAGLGDFLSKEYRHDNIDWVITNPPFNQVDEFTIKALDIARVGVAILARIQFLEGVSRYSNIFLNNPPSVVAPFVQRVTMVKDKIIRERRSTTCFAWFVWYKALQQFDQSTVIRWIPPCQKILEVEKDYEIENVG